MFKSKTHSGVEITKTFTTYNNEDITLKAKKLNAYAVSTKIFQITKALGTAAGAGIDHSKLGMTWSAFAEQINNNLSEDLFEEIQGLLFSEIYQGDIHVTADWWDGKEDIFLEVFYWLLKENFGNFIVRNGMFQRWKGKLQDLLGEEMMEDLQKVLGKGN